MKDKIIDFINKEFDRRKNFEVIQVNSKKIVFRIYKYDNLNLETILTLECVEHWEYNSINITSILEIDTYTFKNIIERRYMPTDWEKPIRYLINEICDLHENIKLKNLTI